MARRRQGRARPREGPLVWIVVGALALSVAVGLADVIPKTERGIRRDEALTPSERLNAAGARIRLPQVPPKSSPDIHSRPLPAAPFEAFRNAVRRTDRFFVDVPRGTHGPFISDGEVVRDYLAYYLLPGIEVRRARDATVVLRYRFDGAYSVRRVR